MAILSVVILKKVTKDKSKKLELTRYLSSIIFLDSMRHSKAVNNHFTIYRTNIQSMVKIGYLSVRALIFTVD